MLRRFLSIFLITCLLQSSQPVAASEVVVLPAVGTMVHVSPSFTPAVLKGIKVDPANPFRFDFILDRGSETSSEAKRESNLAKEDYLKQESTRLIKYFLASLTVPEKDLWVNLSPYEKDRIVTDGFGQTQMGRDLLAQDYLLKQLTASMVYPDDELGKKFWKRVYEEAAKNSGNTEVRVNAFNKVWIVPDKAVVYENAKAGTAYVVESSLKVMTEQDYLSTSVHEATGPAAASPVSSSRHPSPGGVADTKMTLPLALRSKQADAASPVAGTTQIVRETKGSLLSNKVLQEIVLPQLTHEVNEGKNFAVLRQVYNSLILALWYKKKIKDSLLARAYADRNKTDGVGYGDDLNAQVIYQRYLEAFKKGAYNLIKEEIDPLTRQMVPRKYFSGGMTFMGASQAMVATDKEPKSTGVEFLVKADLAMAGEQDLMDMPAPSSYEAISKREEAYDFFIRLLRESRRPQQLIEESDQKVFYLGKTINGKVIFPLYGEPRKGFHWTLLENSFTGNKTGWEVWARNVRDVNGVLMVDISLIRRDAQDARLSQRIDKVYVFSKFLRRSMVKDGAVKESVLDPILLEEYPRELLRNFLGNPGRFSEMVQSMKSLEGMTLDVTDKAGDLRFQLIDKWFPDRSIHLAEGEDLAGWSIKISKVIVEAAVISLVLYLEKGGEKAAKETVLQVSPYVTERLVDQRNSNNFVDVMAISSRLANKGLEKIFSQEGGIDVVPRGFTLNGLTFDGVSVTGHVLITPRPQEHIRIPLFGRNSKVRKARIIADHLYEKEGRLVYKFTVLGEKSGEFPLVRSFLIEKDKGKGVSSANVLTRRWDDFESAFEEMVQHYSADKSLEIRVNEGRKSLIVRNQKDNTFLRIVFDGLPNGNYQLRFWKDSKVGAIFKRGDYFYTFVVPKLESTLSEGNTIVLKPEVMRLSPLSVGELGASAEKEIRKDLQKVLENDDIRLFLAGSSRWLPPNRKLGELIREIRRLHLELDVDDFGLIHEILPTELSSQMEKMNIIEQEYEQLVGLFNRQTTRDFLGTKQFLQTSAHLRLSAFFVFLNAALYKEKGSSLRLQLKDLYTALPDDWKSYFIRPNGSPAPIKNGPKEAVSTQDAAMAVLADVNQTQKIMKLKMKDDEVPNDNAMTVSGKPQIMVAVANVALRHQVVAYVLASGGEVILIEPPDNVVGQQLINVAISKAAGDLLLHRNTHVIITDLPRDLYINGKNLPQFSPAKLLSEMSAKVPLYRGNNRDIINIRYGSDSLSLDIEKQISSKVIFHRKRMLKRKLIHDVENAIEGAPALVRKDLPDPTRRVQQKPAKVVPLKAPEKKQALPSETIEPPLDPGASAQIKYMPSNYLLRGVRVMLVGPSTSKQKSLRDSLIKNGAVVTTVPNWQGLLERGYGEESVSVIVDLVKGIGKLGMIKARFLDKAWPNSRPVVLLGYGMDLDELMNTIGQSVVQGSSPSHDLKDLDSKSDAAMAGTRTPYEADRKKLVQYLLAPDTFSNNDDHSPWNLGITDSWGKLTISLGKQFLYTWSLTDSFRPDSGWDIWVVDRRVVGKDLVLEVEARKDGRIEKREFVVSSFFKTSVRKNVSGTNERLEIKDIVPREKLGSRYMAYLLRHPEKNLQIAQQLKQYGGLLLGTTDSHGSFSFMLEENYNFRWGVFGSKVNAEGWDVYLQHVLVENGITRIVVTLKRGEDIQVREFQGSDFKKKIFHRYLTDKFHEVTDFSERLALRGIEDLVIDPLHFEQKRFSFMSLAGMWLGETNSDGAIAFSPLGKDAKIFVLGGKGAGWKSVIVDDGYNDQGYYQFRVRSTKTDANGNVIYKYRSFEIGRFEETVTVDGRTKQILRVVPLDEVPLRVLKDIMSNPDGFNTEEIKNRLNALKGYVIAETNSEGGIGFKLTDGQEMVIRIGTRESGWKVEMLGAEVEGNGAVRMVLGFTKPGREYLVKTFIMKNKGEPLDRIRFKEYDDFEAALRGFAGSLPMKSIDLFSSESKEAVFVFSDNKLRSSKFKLGVTGLKASMRYKVSFVAAGEALRIYFQDNEGALSMTEVPYKENVTKAGLFKQAVPVDKKGVVSFLPQRVLLLPADNDGIKRMMQEGQDWLKRAMLQESSFEDLELQAALKPLFLGVLNAGRMTMKFPGLKDLTRTLLDVGFGEDFSRRTGWGIWLTRARLVDGNLRLTITLTKALVIDGEEFEQSVEQEYILNPFLKSRVSAKDGVDANVPLLQLVKAQDYPLEIINAYTKFTLDREKLLPFVLKLKGQVLGFTRKRGDIAQKIVDDKYSNRYYFFVGRDDGDEDKEGWKVTVNRVQMSAGVLAIAFGLSRRQDHLPEVTYYMSSILTERMYSRLHPDQYVDVLTVDKNLASRGLEFLARFTGTLKELRARNFTLRGLVFPQIDYNGTVSFTPWPKHRESFYVGAVGRSMESFIIDDHYYRKGTKMYFEITTLAWIEGMLPVIKTFVIEKEAGDPTPRSLRIYPKEWEAPQDILERTLDYLTRLGTFELSVVDPNQKELRLMSTLKNQTSSIRFKGLAKGVYAVKVIKDKNLGAPFRIIMTRNGDSVTFPVSGQMPLNLQNSLFSYDSTSKSLNEDQSDDIALVTLRNVILKKDAFNAQEAAYWLNQIIGSSISMRQDDGAINIQLNTWNRITLPVAEEKGLFGRAMVLGVRTVLENNTVMVTMMLSRSKGSYVLRTFELGREIGSTAGGFQYYKFIPVSFNDVPQALDFSKEDIGRMYMLISPDPFLRNYMFTFPDVKTEEQSMYFYNGEFTSFFNIDAQQRKQKKDNDQMLGVVKNIVDREEVKGFLQGANFKSRPMNRKLGDFLEFAEESGVLDEDLRNLPMRDVVKLLKQTWLNGIKWEGVSMSYGDYQVLVSELDDPRMALFIVDQVLPNFSKERRLGRVWHQLKNDQVKLNDLYLLIPISLRKHFLPPAIGLLDEEILGGHSDFAMKVAESIAKSLPMGSIVPKVKESTGGINLTPPQMRLQTKQSDSGQIQFQLDPAQVAQLQNAPGLLPVIVSILPLADLHGFLSAP